MYIIKIQLSFIFFQFLIVFCYTILQERGLFAIVLMVIYNIITGIFKTLFYENISFFTYIDITGTGTSLDRIVHTVSVQCYFCAFFLRNRQCLIFIFHQDHALCCCILGNFCIRLFPFNTCIRIQISGCRKCCCTHASGRHSCRK